MLTCNVLPQGQAAAETQSWPEAEGLFLRAKQPELALAMYRQAGLWDQALRIAQDYLPAKVLPPQSQVQHAAVMRVCMSSGLIQHALIHACTLLPAKCMASKTGTDCRKFLVVVAGGRGA